MLAALFNEFKSSIKSPDTEEKLDLILYRPFGFLIAKMASRMSFTPSMLSIIGLFFGMLASYYYLDTRSFNALIAASFYFVLSGIFDSSDGQLARLTGQSTKLGLILDGICDSFVTIAIYIACSLPFLKSYGPFFLAIVILALYLHSCQCAILDFYHREYLYFGYGKTENETYWNPGLSDGMSIVNNSKTKLERFMNTLRFDWIKKQQILTTRDDRDRQIMRVYLLKGSQKEREEFMRLYKEHNLGLLPLWRLIGVNAHTFMIILFMFMGRFDVFMIGFDLIIFNLVIFWVGRLQKRADEKLAKVLNLSDNLIKAVDP
ncbi:MAG: CDP-alcohol phosphatidyltransferase family protein [Bacteriovorax sp.]